MDTSEYTDWVPGQLIVEGSRASAYPGFVPHPLPPEISFDVTLAAALAEASAAVGELGGLARTLKNPYLFISPFVHREAVASSRIEGTEADIDELYLYEAGQMVLKGMQSASAEDDVREVRP